MVSSVLGVEQAILHHACIETLQARPDTSADSMQVPQPKSALMMLCWACVSAVLRSRIHC
jgi:hypothetical protein